MNFQDVHFEASYGFFSQIPRCDTPEIVFCGRSNVGKSSLINKLFYRKQLARTSSVPGKTVTINFFKTDCARFVDLPGYGYAKASKKEKERWSSLINGYLCDDRDIVLAILLVDIRRPPTEDDLTMLRFVEERRFPFVIVPTKTDKLSRQQIKERLLNLPKEIPHGDRITILPVSSLSGEGVDDLRQVIREVLPPVPTV